MYAEPMVSATSQLGMKLEVATQQSCPFQQGVAYGTPACRAFVANVIDTVTTTDPPYAAVVIANSGRYAMGAGGPFVTVAHTAVPAESRTAVGFAAAVRKAFEAITRVGPVLVIEPIPQPSGQSFPGCVLPSVLSSVDKTCADMSAQEVRETRTEPVSALRDAMDTRRNMLDVQRRAVGVPG
jgi:hypothetical protein